MAMIEYCIENASKIKYVKGQERLYAVVLDKRGRIVSEAANSYIKTHPKQYYAAKKVGKPHKQYCHAEALALLRSKGKGVKLVVARVNRKGKPLLAKPCPVCEQLIKEHGGIQSVEYTV